MLSSDDLSLAAGKMPKNLLVTGGFRYDFSESQAASCKHFNAKNAALGSLKRLLEGFSKLVSNFKGARKNVKNYQRIESNYLLV
jgi:hypothetical protein